jgi:2-polyprenyl-3-methyl-5-hydroxy-6-metoxy-1,4-benzoquinol methylase
MKNGDVPVAVELRRLARRVLPVKTLRSLRPSEIRSRFQDLLYRSYYKYLFGKETLLSASIRDRIASWERLQNRRDVPVGEALWDAEYAAGVWDDLSQLEELARFSVIAGHIQFLKPGAAVLDVGCGKGILHERLNPASYRRYVGIDFSQAAIARASQRANPQSVFLHADAEQYLPGEEFEVIVFSEVLYILSDPLAVMRRYETALKSGGIFIVSFYEKSIRALAVWRLLKERYNVVDDVRISTETDAWRITVFQPRAAGAIQN